LNEPFVLGVNYWPRRKAMYWWSDFDAGEVYEEFALIHELGLSVVRLFLLWDDFQPSPDSVSARCLENLIKVCDIATEYNLGLDVTFFTGHMSGPNWAPGWLLGGKGTYPARDVRQVVSGGRVVSGSYRNMYTDPAALEGSKLLLRTVVDVLKDHSAVWMWNLGNEPDLFAWPPNARAGRAWVREMARLIRDLDDRHLVTYGLHIDSLHRDNGFRIDQVYAETDVAVMHAYPMYLDWSRSPLDTDLVPFTCALTSALCGKPTLMEEFGGCTAEPGQPSYIREWIAYGKPRKQFMASEDDLAAYLAAVLPRLVEVGATGALIWCFADYVPELWTRPPCLESQHERYFGLVRPDGSLKPHARVLRDFAATHPTVNPEPTRHLELGISPDEFYKAPMQHLPRLFNSFVGGD
jgi:endo-1,4-beta-mannosidase